jgi:3-hydroxyisobutyrate dehydrogenase-like beta-hydroxyacid dehydrogenase
MLNALGMNLTPVAREYGRASAIKLCRSIVIKGLEALMVDCARATQGWGVEAQVFGSLAETFPSVDWKALAADMGERVARHGLRRAAEMREAAAMLEDMGFDASLMRAVADAQERGARVAGRLPQSAV